MQISLVNDEYIYIYIYSETSNKYWAVQNDYGTYTCVT